ncbi:calcium and integrin-binding protein 1-like isoform X1 [Argiope bruennichi]|uniref:Calcium and integrin-binding protein 1 like protein n=1 Tax=Argiope bruennichi TaxID=94029 RepID=A0A8T0F2V0_ARGBR|nr:calcium and integrin-binding protein 1-like isoform X1 [Argiope bruennichi]KAF8785494.1 Calcium and integrin-binding protein 1 like protein [Argiope bruennichi]
MGQKQSILPEEKIREYEILTYLTEREIIKAYEKFCSMNPDVNPESLNPAISLERLDDLPELKVNPFKDRMIWVFTDPVSRCMTFEDYLDMMSVFSERAPLSLKAEYAFKIYDFDDDDLLSRSDLKEILNRLKVIENHLLEPQDWEEILDYVMEDGDIDEDGFIAFTEFCHIMQRVADFASTFVIRL